jgi:hypothetical protein
VFAEEKAWRRPKAACRRRFGPANQFDAALWMAKIPCMMIAGEAIPRCHHLAIDPNFRRICRFSRDFMARIEDPR